MKKLLAVAVLAIAALPMFAASQNTFVQRFSVKFFEHLGIPIAPASTDSLIVFATGMNAGAKYRITLSYQNGPSPAVSSTQDVEADGSGMVRAPFSVTDANTPSIVGWSISEIQQ